jgi:molybdate transport system substrate-binding protein
MFKKIIIFSLFTLIGLPVFAQPVRVAAAANAQFVVKKIATQFSEKTGIAVEVISGSSGKLAVQIKNGAPYDLFLSADMEFAQAVYNDGFALTKPRIYALGSLIVCSSTGAAVKNWKNILMGKSTAKVALANPKLAPYGKAAIEALHYFKLYQSVAARLVFAESISQVNTYVLKKVVNIGFTTESLVYELPAGNNFKWQRVDPAAYQPIAQGAVLLKYAQKSKAAKCKKFYDYLFSADAKAIFKKYGYKIG